MVTKIQQMDQPSLAEPQDEGVAYYKPFQEFPVIGLMPSVYVTEDWAPVVPDQVLLGTVRDGRLRVQSPIRVKLTQEGQNVIANAVEFNEFGFGQNPSEALVDLQHAIAELYFTLDREQDRLGRDLQHVWAKLQRKIHKL